MSSEIKKALGITQDYDKKSADFLSAALARNGKSGFDYIKFRQAINSMSDLSLKEETEFKSAFATARTMSVTKSGLVNSAKHYLSVLMDEKRQFDEALNNQVKERVASKHDEVLKLQQRIDEMRDKINELEKRIAEYNTKIESADDDVEKAKQKIADTKDKFENTFNAFVKIIQEDIARIGEYI